MKNNIHPTYYEDATIICSSCGTVVTTGSTVKEMRVEICSHCHPFYTGKHNLIDTAGRVDRFKQIVHRGISIRTTRAKKTVRRSRVAERS